MGALAGLVTRDVTCGACPWLDHEFGDVRGPAKPCGAAWTAVLVVALGLLAGGVAAADELVLPAQGLARGQTIDVTYRLDRRLTGRGHLDIEWQDADGRLVERRDIAVALDQASKIVFPLDLRRAVATENTLTAHLSVAAADGRGDADDRGRSVSTSFTTWPPQSGWWDYQIIMWQTHTVAQNAALKTLGVTAGMAQANRRKLDVPAIERQIEPLLRNDMGWYLENIATDFYSSYHRWSPGRPVNWRFVAVKKLYRERPDDPAALRREPSLSDPVWLDRIRSRLAARVAAYRQWRPLYYDLGDEAGIADTASFWDFDYSNDSLAAMRQWLKTRYSDLAALNREWGTEFMRWNDVRPPTTRQAMRRSDDNFAAWADFKAWMDVAFSRAVRAGTDAVHAADPHALAALEGAQIPGWGGYDYSRLAPAVDVMELYDYGDNVELARNFNPQAVLLTTSFRSGPGEAHRVWRELLRGSRGLVLWDENGGFVDDVGHIGARGRMAAGYFREMRDGLGALLVNATRELDPVGVVYSPASFRVEWMLDQRGKGDGWVGRSASSEYEDNAIRRSTRGFVGMIEHAGLQQRFLTGAAIGTGALDGAQYRVLILPDVIAMSQRTAAAIRGFLRRGGVVIADGMPGVFDEHGRRRLRPNLSDVFSSAPDGSVTRFDVGKGRAFYLAPGNAPSATTEARFLRLLSDAGVAPAFRLETATGPARDVEIHVFHDGPATIVSLQRDLPAAQPDGASGPEPVVLALPHPSFVYDLREHRALGRTDRLAIALDRYEPTILALADQPLPAPTVHGTTDLRRGDIAIFHLTGVAAPHDVMHVAVIDPAGTPVAHYSGNILAEGGEATRPLPIALNDPVGVWTLRVVDTISGLATTLHFNVVH